MKSIYLAIFLLLFFAGYSQNNTVDYTQKPPAIIVLNINGKDYSVTEGKPLKLTDNFSSPTISAKLANYRKFDNGTVSFNYKSSSNYQYSETTGNKTWTFEDGDCVIFLLGFDVVLKLDDIVGPITEQFGKDNCKTETVSKKIGGKMIEGRQISVTLAGQNLVQEYYEIVSGDAKTYILAFQNLKKDGIISEDQKAAVELVAGSIKF